MKSFPFPLTIAIILLAGGGLVRARGASVPLPRPPAGADASAPILPERSGNGFTTWDLGAANGVMGMRRYAVAIRQAAKPELRLPARLGESPVVWRMAEGDEISWVIHGGSAFPLKVIEGAANRPLNPQPGESLASMEGGSLRLAWRAAKIGMRSELSLPAGWRLSGTEAGEKSAVESQGALTVLDGSGRARLLLRFNGARVLAEAGGDTVQHLTLMPDTRGVVGGVDRVELFVTIAGMYGGYECNVAGAASTAANNYQFAGLYAGEFDHGPGITQYACRGYLMWNLSAALPPAARVTGAWLYPIHAGTYNGSPFSVDVSDIDYGRDLSTGITTYDAAYWSDFGAMGIAGRAKYGSFTVNGIGDYNIQLGSSAVADLMNRDGVQTWFAVGLSTADTTPGHYATFDTAPSTLYLYYLDYAPSGVVLNRFITDNPSSFSPAKAYFYNHGEDLDIGGWILRSVNFNSVTESFTIPAGTVIRRHRGLRLIDAIGSPAIETLFTGGGKFHWGKNLAPFPIQISLLQSGGTGIDYFCGGGATPALPAGAGWSGPCAGVNPFAGSDMGRLYDADTDSGADWGAPAQPDPVNPLTPNQSGARRRSEIVINHFLVSGGSNWISLANYGPPADMTGWSLEIWSGQSVYGTRDGTYTFPAAITLATGEVVWLAEGSAYFGSGANPPADRLHRNLGFAVGWNAPPISGMATLRDGGGTGRDYLVFGQPSHLGGTLPGPDSLPLNLPWVGPFVPVSGGTPDVILNSDQSTLSAAGWTQQAGISNWGMLGPGAKGILRRQEEIGAGSSTPWAAVYHSNYGAGGAFGAGDAFTATRQTALERISFQAAPVAPATPATIVVKQQGVGIIFSRNLVVAESGQTVVSSGLISPPLVLVPGSYAAMLYMNGNWYDSELYNSTERLSFGTHDGYAIESGYVPSAAFTPGGGWSVHGWLTTISPPQITNGAPPDGEAGVAYTFPFTSSGGYGTLRTWSVAAGSLPAGLMIAATSGVLSGTPTQNGTFDFTIRVADEAGMTDSRVYTMRVFPTLAVATSELPLYDAATAPYGYLLQPYGGVGPFAWSCALPPEFAGGLSCTAGGMLSGTLGVGVSNAVYSLTVQVTDSYGRTASRVLKLAVYRTPGILTSSLASGFIGVDYGVERLLGVGGSGAPVWSVSVGSLPPGLSLAGATGAITGTPTTAGNYSFTVTLTNAGGSDSRAFTIPVSQATLPPYWIRRGLAGGTMARVWFSPNFALDGFVMALSGDGSSLYVSRDGGLFWKPANLVLQTQFEKNDSVSDLVTSVAYSPNFDGRGGGAIAITTDHTGVWLSEDGDVSWTPHNLGLTQTATWFYRADAFIFSPNYASTGNAIALSLGPGGTGMRLWRYNRIADIWSPALNSGANNDLAGLAMSPDFLNDGTLFANASYDTLYRSTDKGEHWEAVGAFATNQVTNVEISPNYAADRTVMVKAAPNLNKQAIYISHDNGQSFNPRGAVFQTGEFHLSPAYHANTNPVIYAAGMAGGGLQMMKSLNDGFAFSPTGTGGMPLSEFSGRFSLSPALASDGIILALGTRGLGIRRSQDGGSLWGPSDNGIYAQPIAAVAMASDFPVSGIAFVGTANGIYYTNDGGRAWLPTVFNAPLPTRLEIQAIRVSPAFSTDHTVFAYGCGPMDCRVLKSTDYGRSFNPLATFTSNLDRPDYLRLSPNFGTDQTLFLSTYDIASSRFRFFKSTNAGVSFSVMAPATVQGAGRYGVSPGYAGDATIYLGDYNAAGGTFINRYSTTGGASFSTFGGPTGFFAPSFSPDFNQTTGTNGQSSHTFFWNCQKTVDAGLSFAALDNSACGDVFVSPGYSFDRTLFVFHPNYGTGAPAGLYKSTDGGALFMPLSVFGSPRAFAQVNEVALSPAFATVPKLMVATDYGLFISPDGGLSFSQSTGTESFSSKVTAVVQDLNVAGRVFIGTQDDGVAISLNDGLTADDLTGNLPAGILTPVNALTTAGNPTVLLAALPVGIYRRTDFTLVGSWTQVATGDIRHFETAGGTLFAARADGSSLSSIDDGQSWTALDSALNDATSIADSGAAGFFDPSAKNRIGPATEGVQTSAASLWAASAGAGARYSSNSGATWTLAQGGNDYALPLAAGNYSVVQPLGLNADSGGREVLLGHASLGVFLSRDGGDTWRNSAGAGSGLEATSKNAAAMLATQTAYGTTDILVGMAGSTTGGVYLSGDSGEHWAQVNQGFDPNNLAISSLVKTSCAGCPVQYYSGSYGGGVYTRTLTVVPPPFYTTPASWCAGAACSCGVAPATVAVDGATPIRICGSNFQNGAVVEFDGLPAMGCVQTGGTVINCTAAPAHVAGGSRVRVRNPDTRTGRLPATAFVFSGGTPRGGNSLRVAVSGADALLTWSCGSCTAPAPARIFRSQDSAFLLYLESYNGGVGGSFTNTGAMAAPRSYFWSVE